MIRILIDVAKHGSGECEEASTYAEVGDSIVYSGRLARYITHIVDWLYLTRSSWWVGGKRPDMKPGDKKR